jgi:hypothetical protein
MNLNFHSEGAADGWPEGVADVAEIADVAGRKLWERELRRGEEHKEIRGYIFPS